MARKKDVETTVREIRSECRQNNWDKSGNLLRDTF